MMNGKFTERSLSREKRTGKNACPTHKIFLTKEKISYQQTNDEC